MIHELEAKGSKLPAADEKKIYQELNKKNKVRSDGVGVKEKSSYRMCTPLPAMSCSSMKTTAVSKTRSMGASSNRSQSLWLRGKCVQIEIEM